MLIRNRGAPNDGLRSNPLNLLRVMPAKGRDVNKERAFASIIRSMFNTKF